jgi:hypothetical protein
MIECIDCGGTPIEAFGRCASCNSLQRKLERESKKVKVVKPVKKVSEKRADELLQYPRLKKQYLEFKMHCEIRLEGCTGSSTQIHHVSKDAKNFLNTDTWLGCCPSCHTKCEALPAKQRRSLGFLTD